MEKILVIDLGIGIPHARRLQEDGHRVLYHVMWQRIFPSLKEWLPGFGYFDRVEYLNHDVVEESDVIFIPDMGTGAFADYLRRNGKFVFGGGAAERLEQDRRFQHQVFDELGIKHPRAFVAHGVDQAVDYLAEHPGPHFIKLSSFRGNFETFKSNSALEAETILRTESAKLGPFADTIGIIIENEIKGIAFGVDMIFDGQEFLRPCLMGIESRPDAIEVLSETTPFDRELELLTPWLADQEYRGFFSLEGIIADDGSGNWIHDPCVRMPCPLGVLYPSYVLNYSDVIMNIARGRPVEIQWPDEKFYVVLNRITPAHEVENRWLMIPVAPDDPFVHSMHSAVYDGVVYALPGYSSVVTAVGAGDSVESAYRQARERIDRVPVAMTDDVRINIEDAFRIEEHLGKVSRAP